MTASFALTILCITIVLGMISLGIQIWVSSQLSKAGEKIGAPIGKRSWITPFILGWQHAKVLEITDVMAFWSFILVMTFMGMCVSVYGILAVPTP